MIKQYFKAVWSQLKQQPVMSAVSVIGTALAIFLIMLVVMIQQVRVAPYAPESKRDRFLHTMLVCVSRGESENTISAMSKQTFNHLYAQLKTPEAVTAYAVFTMAQPVGLPGQATFSVDMRGTDDVYWKVFDFEFVDGKPFDKAIFTSAQRVAIITESVALRLFGTTQACGREFEMAHTPFRVSGVVKDVSTMAYRAYAQIWVPYTVGIDFDFGDHGGILGSLSATILARSSSDFPKIREEIKKNLLAYNGMLKETGYRVIDFNQPYNQEKASMLGFSNIVEPDVAAVKRTQWMIFLILLIVPAINLSSMTQSRYRQRVSEIGVRRAFGCTRSELVVQLLGENLILTIAAGIVALLLSIGFAYIGTDFLFIQNLPTMSTEMPEVNITMLLQFSTFGWALFFCFVLNLLSTCIPAWKASRMNIVNALEGSTFTNR